MTTSKVRQHARYAPKPTPEPDRIRHLSAPLVVQVGWSEQRGRWVWFEYLDEIEDVLGAPVDGCAEIRDPAVDGQFTAYVAGGSYGRLSRRRRSQTDVVMSIEELSDYRELLALVEGPVDWQGAGEGSRRWRAIAKRVIREYFYEPSAPRSWRWVAEHPGRPDQSPLTESEQATLERLSSPPFTGSDPLMPGSRRWQRLRARIIRERLS